MIDNFIRGGQIFLHNVAMFRQVLGKTLIISLMISVVITCYLSVNRVKKVDLPAGITYVKANASQWIHNNISIFARDRLRPLPRMDAYDKRGLYAANATAKVISNQPKFKLAYKIIEALALEVALLAGYITVGLITVVFIIWAKFGKQAKESKLVKGDTVLTAQQVMKVLKGQQLVSDFKIGEMPLVKGQETRHILVTGMTGAGKTNFLNILLPQIRKKNQPGLVIDQTGEMIARYYEPERGDIIFNPFDGRSKEWDFWREVEQVPRLNTIATSIFCATKVSDPMWNNSSRQVFIDSVTQLLKWPDRSLKGLYELITTLPLKQAYDILRGTAAAALLDPKGERTAMSIRSNTIAFVNWLKYLPEHDEAAKIAITDWVPEAIANGRGSWLFISSFAAERTLLQPLQSLMLDLAVLSLQSLKPDHERRFWIIADELASLKKLQVLPQGLAELRKYGGCILAGIQSLNQLFELYGQYLGSTMFGQFATKFIFRNDEPSMAKLITEMIGTIEYIDQHKNTSYGAHEHRDGVSYNEHRGQKLLLTPSDLSRLNNLECYVHLPMPTARIAKIKMPFVPAPKKMQDEFIDIKKDLGADKTTIFNQETGKGAELASEHSNELAAAISENENVLWGVEMNVETVDDETAELELTEEEVTSEDSKTNTEETMLDQLKQNADEELIPVAEDESKDILPENDFDVTETKEEIIKIELEKEEIINKLMLEKLIKDLGDELEHDSQAGELKPGNQQGIQAAASENGLKINLRS